MLGWSGRNVCTITWPGASPRPARPATCTRSWNVRSAARKSGTLSDRSASTTATSVTPGTSWPLLTICVPTRMSVSPACQLPRMRRCAPVRWAASRSSRATAASGWPARSAVSIRSVPRPTAQGHDLDRRQGLGGRPLGQLEERMAAVTGGLVALGRRRRGGEDHHGARPPGAHDPDVAGVVAQAVLLLVGRVVLLVDDDEA